MTGFVNVMIFTKPVQDVSKYHFKAMLVTLPSWSLIVCLLRISELLCVYTRCTEYFPLKLLKFTV